MTISKTRIRWNRAQRLAGEVAKHMWCMLNALEFHDVPEADGVSTILLSWRRGDHELAACRCTFSGGVPQLGLYEDDLPIRLHNIPEHLSYDEAALAIKAHLAKPD